MTEATSNTDGGRTERPTIIFAGGLDHTAADRIMTALDSAGIKTDHITTEVA